jgi:amino acid transporter
VIGSGIFFKANIVAGSVGRFDLVLLVWIVCGILSLLGALATAELGAMMPHAGGQYVYLREAYGPLSAFLWGWAEFWMMRAGSVAALAVAFSQAFFRSAGLWLQEMQWIQITTVQDVDFIRLPDGTAVTVVWAMRGIAVAAIVILTMVNYAGTRWGGMLQNITTVAKISTLAVLMILPFLTMTADASLLTSTAERAAGTGLLAGMAAAMTAVFWAYDGWGNIGPVAEEIRDPQRNIPLALGAGMLLVILLYVGVTVSYHLLMPAADIAKSSFVAASACEITLGKIGSAIASAAVMVSTFGALNANLLTGPRVIFAMARDGVFFSMLARVHSRFRTPHIAILALSTWAVLLIVGSDLLRGITVPQWIGSLPKAIGEPLTQSLQNMSGKAIYDVLTDYVVFGAFVFYLLSVVAVFVLRIRQPDLPRPYRTIGYPLLPALFVLGSTGFLLGMLVTSPVESILGLGFIATGAAIYGLLRPLMHRGNR